MENKSDTTINEKNQQKIIRTSGAMSRTSITDLARQSEIPWAETQLLHASEMEKHNKTTRDIVDIPAWHFPAQFGLVWPCHPK